MTELIGGQPANYEQVFIYGSDGGFRGYAIKKLDVPKLDSVNIWAEGEEAQVKEALDKLNNENLLRQFWPDFADPDVLTLVEDPDWESLELEEVDTIDHEKSTLVPIYESYIDEFGGRQSRDTGEVDWAKSTIVFKKVMAPNAQKAQARVFKAMEQVARQRALATSG